jgi:hypothetical protein
MDYAIEGRNDPHCIAAVVTCQGLSSCRLECSEDVGVIDHASSISDSRNVTAPCQSPWLTQCQHRPGKQSLIRQHVKGSVVGLGCDLLRKAMLLSLRSVSWTDALQTPPWGHGPVIPKSVSG